MSTCNCPKQDQYANCCMRKIAERKCEDLRKQLDAAQEKYTNAGMMSVLAQMIHWQAESEYGCRTERGTYQRVIEWLKKCIAHTHAQQAKGREDK